MTFHNFDTLDFTKALSGSRIMWMLGEKEENDPDLVEHQARDIADHGFVGVLITPRAGRYDLRDPKMLDLLEKASHAAKSNGLEIWLMADPRLASDSLIAETGECLEVLIINRIPEEQWDGVNPYSARIENSKFEWIMEYPAIRHTHMHPSGGITYSPVSIEQIVSFEKNNKTQATNLKYDSSSVKWIHDKANKLVKVNGDVDQNLNGYEVTAFPRFKTNFFDYTSEKSWEIWESFIDMLFERIDNIKGICWDEPGFYAEFGVYPAGQRIYDAFLNKYDYNLVDNLAWLILPGKDNIHVKVRNNYFKLLNEIIAVAVNRQLHISMKAVLKHIRSPVQNGIHATWHGEFCGLEDMNHGSLDLWKIRLSQTAAFTDIGGAERIIDPGSAPDVIYSLVLGRSLRCGLYPSVFFCNLWGNDFGNSDSKAPIEIMDYWVDLLRLYNAEWLAHAYGYTGTTKKDMGFGPGYPDHPSWSRFKQLNKPQNDFELFSRPLLPVTDVLFIFPIEFFYSINGKSGNSVSHEIVKLVDSLVRSGYMLDILPSYFLGHAQIVDNQLTFENNRYNSIILPFGTVVPNSTRKIINKAIKSGIPVIANIPNGYSFSPSGKILPSIVNFHGFRLGRDSVETIKKIIKPTVILPKGALGNAFESDDYTYIRLMPDRMGGHYEGILGYKNHEIKIEKSATLQLFKLERTDDDSSSFFD